MNYKKLAIFLILNTFYMPALDGNEYDSKITVLYVEDDSVLFPAKANLDEYEIRSKQTKMLFDDFISNISELKKLYKNVLFHISMNPSHRQYDVIPKNDTSKYIGITAYPIDQCRIPLKNQGWLEYGGFQFIVDRSARDLFYIQGKKTHELNYVYYVNDSEHIYDPEWWVYKIVGKDCTPVLIWPSVQ